VTVLEMADRVMNRVVASSVSEYFAHEHRTQGIKIICGTRVVRLEGAGSVERVVCTDGSTYKADLVIVAVGAVPNAELAAAAGLACDNGIVVDEYCCSSDLIVGLSQGFDQQVLRGDPATRSFSVCYLKGGELIAVEAVNHSKDYMAGRKLIGERARPNFLSTPSTCDSSAAERALDGR
jgi:flavin-dependent dehydrogenase